MNAWELLPVYLLVALGVALSISFGVLASMVQKKRSFQIHASPSAPVPQPGFTPPRPPSTWIRPNAWLAIRGHSLEAVQKALGLSNPKPCSWYTGISGDAPLFIAPPINGWILVIGSCLPDPTEDIDAFFRFIMGLSRKLGHVQFFWASQPLQHHAWVQVDAGRVVRAFVWAGKTLWKQGATTPAEKNLDLHCPDYCEDVPCNLFTTEPVGANTEKIPLLASQWSFDPAGVDQSALINLQGVVGRLARKL